MNDLSTLQSLLGALETECATLTTQMASLENQLSALPNISQSGPGTSFTMNITSQLEGLTRIRGEKIEQIRVLKILCAESGPGVFRKGCYY